ncbi:MAG TPA: hypothetical protein VGL53_15460 [Bryobacteraceae bacterium]|jgi:arsenate reductase
MRDRTGLRPPPVAKVAASPKKRVLFVCIGNACRSQMAEAFAKRYGSDAAEISSAGLSPAASIPELTRAVMKDKNIPLTGHAPKGIEVFVKARWDLIVNISGQPLPHLQTGRVVEWKIQDPMGMRQAVHEKVRDEIESLVMRLILELRGPARRTSLS